MQGKKKDGSLSPRTVVCWQVKFHEMMTMTGGKKKLKEKRDLLTLLLLLYASSSLMNRSLSEADLSLLHVTLDLLSRRQG